MKSCLYTAAGVLLGALLCCSCDPTGTGSMPDKNTFTSVCQTVQCAPPTQEGSSK